MTEPPVGLSDEAAVSMTHVTVAHVTMVSMTMAGVARI
jgi:hypothetical protein